MRQWRSRLRRHLGTYGGVLTGVGVLSYAGDGVTAHVSVAADNGCSHPTLTDRLRRGKDSWKLHAGFTGGWDPIKVVGAFSTDDTGYWNALGSVAATFDMFTLAASGEAATDGWGVGGSATASVTDGVTLNLGGRYWQNTETRTDRRLPTTSGRSKLALRPRSPRPSRSPRPLVPPRAPAIRATRRCRCFYGTAGLAWAPGGGFKSGVSGKVASDGGYKAVFTASKSIK